MEKVTIRQNPFGQKHTSHGIAGNGLTRTAMVFGIAKIGGVKLTVPQLNKIKTLNPRSLERVYDEVLRVGDQDNARFALNFILK